MPVKQPEFVRQFLQTEFFRYLVAGSIAFICDFSILVFCTEVLGVHYLYSNIAGYAVGLIVSYTINIKWVFDHRRFDDRQGREFIYFTFIVLAGLGISELVIWLVTESIELPYTWSKVVSTFFVFLFNFIAKKWLLFSPTRH
jgi:putative flippase GtrA